MSGATARRRRPTHGPLAGRVPVTAENSTLHQIRLPRIKWENAKPLIYLLYLSM
jgi:hypothetical protein